MAIPIKKIPAADSLATISNVLVASFVLAGLYFGRELLVPLALAALLTFMLSPLITRLQRWLGRVGSVLCVVAMMFTVTGAIGWVLTRQTVDLVNQLPDYKENIRTKLKSIQFPQEGPFSRLSETLNELKKDLPGNPETQLQPNAEKTETAQAKQATQVEVVNGEDKRVQFMREVVTPILGPLGSAALVLLLLIFMLLQREDLRNRLIRLIGQGRISATTLAMDDAGSRVSKYLLMQLVVNVTYGIPVAVGLYFIGVPNAVLWGALATVMRFIPYIGPWIAAAFPILLSLAVAPSWTAPVLTVALFVVLELFSNNVMEPWLYGTSTGVTPIALILAALVWTYLWGPVGLVLATPLTVCLVVMGRHIPKLAFLSVALSDEEPLTPAEDFYHRLHRSGEHDEMEFVDNYLKTNPMSSLFDQVLIPVITAAENDHRLQLLEADQLQSIERGMSEILDDLEERLEGKAPLVTASAAEAGGLICCVPARAYRDELAGEMLGQLLVQAGYTAQNASATMVSGELVGWVRDSAPDLVCVSVVAPSSLLHARNLCSKLRKGFPDLKLVVGLWGSPGKNIDAIKVLQDSGADEVVTSVAEAAERIVRMARMAIPVEAVA